jgi:hypothetical protein
VPSEGSILLGEVAAQLATVDISCNFCPRRGKANIGRLYAGAPARHAHTRAAEPAVSRLPETPYGPCRRAMRSELAAAGGCIREGRLKARGVAHHRHSRCKIRDFC